MFICRCIPDEASPNGRVQILEATPEVLEAFVRDTAKDGSRASEDAVLLVLTNGTEVRSSKSRARWYRVNPPARFSPHPTHCDITKAPLGPIMYDGRTRQGPWAIMSAQAWNLYGCGKLGAGNGQMYRRAENGSYYLSEGMSTTPRSYRVPA